MEIQNLVLLVLRGFSLALLARAVLSWFPSSGALAPVHRVLRAVTEPVLSPIRRVLPAPRLGGFPLDLSVVVALVAVQLLSRVVLAV